jgi:general secretion pathway protein G
MIKKERLEIAGVARKGFTLIEILIVVAIIAILASVVLVGLGPTQQAGRDARRLSDLTEVQNGLELYYNACGYYPGTDSGTPCQGWADAGGYSGLSTTLLSFKSLGITTVPNDPTAGHHYYYATNTGGSEYILGADLENKQNSVFTTYSTPSDLGDMQGGDSGSLTCKGSLDGQYCVSI